MEALDAHSIQFAPKIVIISTWIVTAVIDTLSTPYQKKKEIRRVTLLDPKCSAAFNGNENRNNFNGNGSQEMNET